MKNRHLLLSFTLIVAALFTVISACRKINDPTELGGDLIPPVDNINTFETYLDIETDLKRFTDTNRVYFDDDLALGHITSDPEFGTIHANGYFSVSSAPYATYPFGNKDSIIGVDSVILSLSYEGGYGDTANSFQTLRVFEIAQNSGFNDTTGFRYDHANFATTGPELGNKTFQVKTLKDSIRIYRKSGDTSKLANVIRIKLANNLATRLMGYDTSTSAIGAYHDDTSFKKLFKGFAIQADVSGNALTYFAPGDNAKTKLTVYYRNKRGTVIDTLATEFTHITGGQANTIQRGEGGNYLATLNNSTANDPLLYLAATPGSYATLKIPGLSTMANAVIHRAEIIMVPVASSQDNIFFKPPGLFLDRLNAAGDTAFTFDTDMSVSNGGSFLTYDATLFGGLIKSDQKYHFNISRYVQSIVTNHVANSTLRLYVPVRAFVYSKSVGVLSQIYVNSKPAYGRVVLGGGSNVDLTKRMRLRIVYSKI